MTYDKLTDSYIKNDKSEGYANSKRHVEEKDFDENTREYYLRIIRVKNALENGMSESQRFLFVEYFFGFS